ncbi:MAG: metal-dependent hydrolase [Planctomycetales bacterium]|nr:metal-dependent hydrolase [Planctomycetales bacterium]NIM09178.1 metal-dependent hydrolase [Planctomycetales bacterium]NIN08654.1 metal-dependent hydrolase [Planctomycetales bacterium]NIN77773.1 metal-dependent hydrolase [Planctomycetales bacterium]NIO34950.1 metal-dependent hydrolase [Planctomycetales bacterium]
MATELTWLGHGTWLITTGNHRILLDPFLDESPTAPIKADQVEVDTILVSHGHFDHVADLVSIARRTGATVVSCFEICEWVAKQGIEKTEPMNLGGGIDLPFGRVTMTVAHHSSGLPDGTYGGNAGGFHLAVDDGTIYFACDTALFSDMQQIGAGGLDLAVVPIGDRFTMGPADAVQAIKLLKPRLAAPAHYNTWPPIQQDAAAWAERIRAETDSEPVVVEPGGKIGL